MDLITETLEYLRTTTVVTQPERDPAYDFALAFVNTNFPVDKAHKTARHNFCLGMSLGWPFALDLNKTRKRKRATYLLSEAIHAKDGLFRAYVIANISDTQARTKLIDTIRKARIVADIGTGGHPGSDYVLDNVLAPDPLTFLATNTLVVHGSNIRDLTNAPKNPLVFNFGFDPSQDRYMFDAAIAFPGSCTKMVDSVLAVCWSDVPGRYDPNQPNTASFAAIEPTLLSEGIGVTTQFTGCTFCMKRVGHDVYCAHVAPRGVHDIGGNALAHEIAGDDTNVTAGDFAAPAQGGPPISIYGPGYSRGLANGSTTGYPGPLGGGQSWVTIIAVKHGNDYDIYSQVTLNRITNSYQRIF